jgi:hypothetical protein
MVKSGSKSRQRSTKQTAWEITERAADAVLRHQELADAPVFFEDTSKAAVRDVVKTSKSHPLSSTSEMAVLKPKLHVDLVLQARSKVAAPPQARPRKGIIKVEETLTKRVLKRLAHRQPSNPKKGNDCTIKDSWTHSGAEPTCIAQGRLGMEPFLLPQAMSYRPEETAQLALLGTMERREERELADLQRVQQVAQMVKTNVMSVGRNAAPFSSEDLQEVQSFDDDAPPTFGGNYEPASTKAPRKKTGKERARQAAHRSLQREQQRQKLERQQAKQFARLPELAKQVQRAVASEQAAGNKGQAVKRRAKLAVSDVILPEERPASLTQVSTSGHVLADMFGSICRRLGLDGQRRRIPHRRRIKYRLPRNY